MKEAILIGLFAYVFCNILTDTGMIFGKYYQWLQKLPEWLAKPLGMCEYCFAGQIALWYYLIVHFATYNFAWHVGFITVAIFTVDVLQQIMAVNKNY